MNKHDLLYARARLQRQLAQVDEDLARLFQRELGQQVVEQPTANSQQPIVNIEVPPVPAPPVIVAQPVDAAAVTVPVEPVARRFVTGFHGRSDPLRLTPDDVYAIDTAGVDGVLMMTNQDPADLVWLQGKFVPVRIYWDSGTLARSDGAAYVRVFGDAMQRWYDAGKRWFQIHNEPNLRLEGAGRHWSNGAEFSAWYVMLQAGLKQRFPEAKFGFPGLSPLPATTDGVGIGLREFLNGCEKALQVCDWVGVHSYWQKAEHMHSKTFGMSWQTVTAAADTANGGFRKPVYMTEFANTHPHVGGEERGRQYVQYYALLRAAGLDGAFAFHLNHVNADAWPEQRVVGSGIAEVMGAR